ncbi:hypothetical protein NC653_025636 [Populus alba x Populus x berolinensis]|uniref:Uncharacterized protein n=1 Tax=Populus alba x Populus x berolinensis TaxID=444605 RepID=A0AAD6Q7Z1_9ROSI|nr:hypothetical protein NC653_025636 [Populus alba x Populus x berolinensis]
MGFKRPFDDEEFQDLPFKQARQVDYCNKLTQFSETGAHSYMPLKPDITDDCRSSFVKPLWHETFENDKVIEVSNLAKDSDSSAPLSLVSCSSSDENFGSGMAASPEYFQFEFPRKMSMPLKDVHSFYLDDFPRKQIPLGPNHQASIPLWDNHIKKDKLVQYPNGSSLSESDHHIYNDNEEKLMGTCIIPMPDTELQRCSSYYFNVFMLRKRAAQNRSNPLDIDSDDDEFPRIHRGSHIQVVEQDEDSDLESPVDQYDDAGLEEDILEDDDNDDDGSGGDFDGDFGDGDGDTTGEGFWDRLFRKQLI